jgi:hypothetical protein
MVFMASGSFLLQEVRGRARERIGGLESVINVRPYELLWPFLTETLENVIFALPHDKLSCATWLFDPRIANNRPPRKLSYNVLVSRRRRREKTVVPGIKD